MKHIKKVKLTEIGWSNLVHTYASMMNHFKYHWKHEIYFNWNTKMLFDEDKEYIPDEYFNFYYEEIGKKGSCYRAYPANPKNPTFKELTPVNALFLKGYKEDRFTRYPIAGGIKKFPCPKCGNISLKKFLDKKNNYTYLPDEYGLCLNKSCGYFKYPSDYEPEDQTENSGNTQ